ncbi:Periplasmic thiol:disulfide interchange protein DsbA [Liberibacter crescens BT-1]|uniref:Periplasmic thiol:disulfide interchange protein DsbA n=1 Tax=Liberibacter crescens (strain BT-1) TaxID=1215343 RepID=L0EY46_LIBCB|nr:DsbA family protein [Liberibacter crescens]AGA65306.1 Periplasmic thiol:disulfide interchange protein DsbA [Liberibacter crescens BT-1]
MFIIRILSKKYQFFAGIAVLMMLFGCGDEGKKDNSTKKAVSITVPEADGEVYIKKLLVPGPMKEISIGNQDSPVKIVEYVSMTCVHCADFHNRTLDLIKKKYIDTGKVLLIVREFPLDVVATAAFMLARCLEDQGEGKYLAFISMLFKQQKVWLASDNNREALFNVSKVAGFSQESFKVCLTNQKLLDNLNAVKENAAKNFGVNSTPTFFINGKRYLGDMSEGTFSAIIDKIL